MLNQEHAAAENKINVIELNRRAARFLKLALSAPSFYLLPSFAIHNINVLKKIDHQNREEADVLTKTLHAIGLNSSIITKHYLNGHC